MKTYEYAGFMFEVVEENGKTLFTPAPGQHPAAYKTKHLINAMDMYRQEQKEKRNA